MKFPLAIVFAALVGAAPASAAVERGRRAVSSADEEAARQEAVAARRMEGSIPMDDAKAADADADTEGGDSISDDAAASAASSMKTKQSTKSSKSKGGGRSDPGSEWHFYDDVDIEIEGILSDMTSAARSNTKLRFSEAVETYRVLPRHYRYLFKSMILQASVVNEAMADRAGRRMEERDRFIKPWIFARSANLQILMVGLVTDLNKGISSDRAYLISAVKLKGSKELLPLIAGDDEAPAEPSVERCLFESNQFWAARAFVKDMDSENYYKYFQNITDPEVEDLVESAYFR
ncbi:hypothetical protein ACHAWF_006572, partial [Thalassiosira exigua]